MNAAVDLERISSALGNTPRVAYTAPHVYPHAAPAFEPQPFAERPRPGKDFLRLYVHIPFCNYACSFCCYAKRVGVKTEQMARYLGALKQELEWIPQGTPVSQFFVGGGTPTALPAQLFDQMLESICARMPNHGTPVHTVEASPESLTPEHLAILKARGVGRVSMGIQSLREDLLDKVSRTHGEQTAVKACEMVLDAGLILNVDLIYGLPGQREEDFSSDFARAAAIGVHAVTAYSLRLNEYTPVASVIKTEEQLNLDRLIRWRTTVRDTARELGYTQTRWHTFKRLDSIAARHERLPCFDDDDMLGYQFGAGISARSHLGHTVYRNHKGLNTYMERMEAGQSPVEEVFRLAEDDRQTQFIARTIGDGRPLRFAEYQQTFGRDFQEDYGDVLRRLEQGGLIDVTEDTATLSETGKLVYDLVTLALYPPRAQRWLLERLKDYQTN